MEIALGGHTETGNEERLLARRPVVGVIMFLVGSFFFLMLYLNLRTNGPLAGMDTQLSQSFHTWAVHSSPFVRWFMLTGSWIGQNGLIMLSLALGILWIVQRRWPQFLMLALGVVGCELAYQVLGRIINRPRPVFPDPIEVLKGPGFPSGHTSVGLALFGLLLYLAWPHLRTRAARTAGVAILVLLLLYISISRLFQGVHYPTDLLSGFALGLAWCGLVYTPVEVVAARRKG